jgi:hypothetical protein
VSFLIVTFTRRARGGEDIRRSQTIEGDEAVIGRGADCEIRLPDLAVSLRHARLRRLSTDAVLVEALGTQPFEVDGQFVRSAELSLARKPRLILGSNVLTLGPADADNIVPINLSRIETDAGVEEGEVERKVFSLASARGMDKRRLAWALAAFILTVCLAWPAAFFLSHSGAKIHPDQQWSSGPLSKAHAFLGKQCQACHQAAFVAVRDEACLSCHQAGTLSAISRAAFEIHRWGGPDNSLTLVREHADHDRLLRATPLPADFGGKVQAIFRRTFSHPNDRCASCHLEHVDAAGRLIAQGNPAAPARERPALVRTTGCVACHGQLRERISQSAVLDTPDWRRHPEFRPVIKLSPDAVGPAAERVSLVQSPLQYSGLTFSHRTHLLESGGVARMARELGLAPGPLQCANCHRSERGGKGFAPVEMVRDCAGCHSLVFTTAGGAPQTLPHGHPEQIAERVRDLDALTPSRPTAPVRRLPGVSRIAWSGPPTRAVAGVAEPGQDVAAQVRAIFDKSGACGGCHTVVAPKDPASLSYRVIPVRTTDRYLPWGDFDHSVPAHRKDPSGRSTCGDCHRVAKSDSLQDVALPRIAQCAACHGKAKSPRAPQAASADCTECHSYHDPGAATPAAYAIATARAGPPSAAPAAARPGA